MSQNVLNSLPIIAHAIGRSCGVKVRCGGQAACTDGRVVVLPDSDSVPRNVLLGYLVHECAHVRYTDFSLSFPHTIVRWLTNVYEDARIERKINREYIGANRLLQATMRHLQTESTKTPTDPVETLLSFAALDCWSRYRLMGDVLEEPYRRAESQVRQWFSVGDLQTIRSINDELPLAKDTAHCRQMAQRLFDPKFSISPIG